MKKYILILLTLSLLNISVFAQLSDDFSDGNFTSNPVWSGDDTFFEIESQQLNSKGDALGGEHYLSTPNTRINDAEWRFLVDLQFAPSGSNQSRIYLVASDPNLLNPQNGYYVQIGESGDDEIRIYEQTGTSTNLIFTGSTSFSGNFLARIKILRDNAGDWEVLADPSGGESFVSEGTFTDNTHTSTTHFGVICKYTGSRKDLFYFDDFYIGDEIIDTEAPTISSITVIDQDEIEVTFSENVQELSVETEANYSVNNSIGNPLSALRDATDLNKVKLSFMNNFADAVENTLTINNVQDLNGNAIGTETANFTYVESFEPEYHELLITEIFPDPTGDGGLTLGLPEAEFIEIYNRSDKRLELRDCKLTDLTDETILPSELIEAGEYIILCAEDDEDDFASFGRVIGLTSFPSLNNSSDRLTLKDKNGKLLFVVEYSDEWYNNNTKTQGAWTLEMKDVNNPCLDAENWTASENPQGGTPAQANSVSETLADITPPTLLRAEAIDTNEVRLTFSEKMDSLSAMNASYIIDNNITVASVRIDLEVSLFQQVFLTLNENLQENIDYTITLENIRDCNQNPIEVTNKVFGLPQEADSTDIILNEILFNPYTSGSDFVELYNQSDKYINLKDWGLARIFEEAPDDFIKISEDDFIISPKSYLVLTTSPANIKTNYPKSEEETFWEMSSMPSYNDDEGIFILLNANGDIWERFDYTEDYHFELLDEEEGVSLERISFSAPSNAQSSWQSAAGTEGFATPGYLNSQTFEANPSDAKIQITPQTFTPDNDGNQDFTIIQYKFSQSGYVLTVQIYDRRGRKVKTLANNLSLGTAEGFLTWDGDNDSGNKVNIGYYLVLIEVFNLQGEKEVFKEKVVVGMRF